MTINPSNRRSSHGLRQAAWERKNAASLAYLTAHKRDAAMTREDFLGMAMQEPPEGLEGAEHGNG